MSELLQRAFLALGQCPTWRELLLVGDAVRESGDEEAIAALTLDNMPALKELARGAGSSEYVALDLICEVGNPPHAAIHGDRNRRRSTE